MTDPLNTPKTLQFSSASPYGDRGNPCGMLQFTNPVNTHLNTGSGANKHHNLNFFWHTPEDGKLLAAELHKAALAVDPALDSTSSKAAMVKKIEDLETMIKASNRVIEDQAAQRERKPKHAEFARGVLAALELKLEEAREIGAKSVSQVSEPALKALTLGQETPIRRLMSAGGIAISTERLVALIRRMLDHGSPAQREEVKELAIDAYTHGCTASEGWRGAKSERAQIVGRKEGWFGPVGSVAVSASGKVLDEVHQEIGRRVDMFVQNVQRGVYRPDSALPIMTKYGITAIQVRSPSTTKPVSMPGELKAEVEVEVPIPTPKEREKPLVIPSLFPDRFLTDVVETIRVCGERDGVFTPEEIEKMRTWGADSYRFWEVRETGLNELQLLNSALSRMRLESSAEDPNMRSYLKSLAKALLNFFNSPQVR